MILVEVLVLYYTRGGKTEALARAVAEGVVSSGTPSEEDLSLCRKLGEALAKVALKGK